MLFQLLLMADDTRLELGWKGTLVVGRGSCSAIPQVADRWLCADRLKWMRVPSPRIPPLAPGEPLARGREGGAGVRIKAEEMRENLGDQVKARRSWKVTNLRRKAQGNLRETRA